MPLEAMRASLRRTGPWHAHQMAGRRRFEARTRDRGDLDRHVRHVAAVPLESLPEGAPRPAHMINAYNALSMCNVLQSGIPATHTATRTVWLSELLDFHPEDFVPRPAASLLAYANRYAPRPAPGCQVRFTPSDWTITNSRRPRAPGRPATAD